MECTFCHDQCCSFGTDIDFVNINRIMKYEKELEQFINVNSEDWFYKKKRGWDHEYPGHLFTRTTKRNNACVFLNPKGRGCMLHSFALEKGIDHRELKPFFCSIFPVTYYEGVLVIPEEIEEKTLACLGNGPTLYRGARDAIRYYFGDEIIVDLDRAEAQSAEPKRKSA